MSTEQKVAVVTGASQGIGAGILQAFRDRNYRVVATSRSIKPSADSGVVTVQGDIGAAETAVRVLTDLMRVVGIESYDHALPLGRLLQDALALPLFGGGNVGVRRRQLHMILKRPEYDPLMTSSEAEV